jgi:hypothetical protein
MPQPVGPGSIAAQPNAALNSANKLFSQLLGELASAVTSVATLITSNSNAG